MKDDTLDWSAIKEKLLKKLSQECSRGRAIGDSLTDFIKEENLTSYKEDIYNSINYLGEIIPDSPLDRKTKEEKASLNNAIPLYSDNNISPEVYVDAAQIKTSAFIRPSDSLYDEFLDELIKEKQLVGIEIRDDEDQSYDIGYIIGQSSLFVHVQYVNIHRRENPIKISIQKCFIKRIEKLNEEILK